VYLRFLKQRDAQLSTILLLFRRDVFSIPAMICVERKSLKLMTTYALFDPGTQVATAKVATASAGENPAAISFSCELRLLAL
jgi:hypothetical protein